MWQTDLADFKVIGWGWLYLSTILDDFSRHIIVWKPCTTMPAEDVTETLKLAREASGGYHADVVHKPRPCHYLKPSFSRDLFRDILGLIDRLRRPSPTMA